jgi:acyl transferase domain-containing protein/NAD(P)H-dependent flavin oxidoreductase YrpB (nitropropane dioxygenase family)/NADP-dependent 3-hydroxy acid dehydrogenase YdfG
MGGSQSIVIGITPFGVPNARLAVALARAGAGAVLDLGVDREVGLRELAQTARLTGGAFGVRLDPAQGWADGDLPASVETVVLPAGADPEAFPGRRTLVQVVSLEEASVAEAAGATGLIAVGSECGGRIGDEGAFILSQRLLSATELPVWVQGGIGLSTAAACVAGGAAGVVLESQLALVREAALPEAVQKVLRKMDGSETTVLAGYRVFSRPDLKLPGEMVGAEAEAVRARLGCGDLTQTLLPAGQDAALAAPLARRFETAGRLVAGLSQAIDESLRAARKLEPLAPGSPMATEHGTRYPLLQGPMTRVSDRSAFAEAVAEGGGLPFLALALMRGPQVRELVEETAERLGDRPWGVGILGFVPPDRREEQVAVLRDLRPPFAIIAGGRPSQARELEALGIRTYLHVPSPGLLEAFLKDGARRFIFEGQECGGHVGPRTSFTLWEQQLELLSRFERPTELSVVFAGGIHDARSGAMVAAMAARLADKGAHVGALMGTAYLFTDEAVASGAILPGYQRMAVGCSRTVLLETAPGHATRCVESDYVRAFRSAKEELEAEGLGPKEVWARLEDLNLGRLRMASKGLRREGDTLADLSEDEQVHEGMYMIGQVATMHGDVTSIESLHEEISVGSVEHLSRGAERPMIQVESRPADIAIVGMACVFAEAPDLDHFWRNIVTEVDAISEVPPERWNPAIYVDPEGQPGRTSPTANGGFISPVPFETADYGIPPRSVSAIDPGQLLSLEVARRALEDAGYWGRDFDREHTSVIFGAEGGSDLTGAYGFRAFYRQIAGELPAELEHALPEFTEDTFPGVLANVIAGRIANRLDLGGMNFTVDAACASALAAIEAGVRTLVAGTSNLALVGGTDFHNSIYDYLLFSSVHAISQQGRSMAFDQRADGMAMGEGVGVVVLKRLADAERDGDRIYAVIKAIAGSSDGRHLGLTAPRKDGQVRALRRAYAQAGISPAQVQLMEAHGTGTVLGDRTELLSMESIFSEFDAQPASCSLGSVKSMIGHTKCAAGIASVIKTALALHHGVRPPTLHVENPNTAWVEGQSSFGFDRRARPWKPGHRIAGVSSFGFGGTNFHAVLAEHRDPLSELGSDRTGLKVWPVEVFLFRGADRQEAAAQMQRLQGVLERGMRPDERAWPLAELARATAEAGSGPVQAALLATSAQDLLDRLAAARRYQPAEEVFYRSEESSDLGKVAFLFPGQGSQRVGMGAELFVVFPFLDDLLAAGGEWLDRIYPHEPYGEEAQKRQVEALTDTRVAQPALGLVALAVARVLDHLGIKADMAGGHSYGELAALCAGGALSTQDLFALSAQRAEAILAAAGDDPGGMAAVAASPEQIEPYLESLDGVVIANRNTPRQTVISGPHAPLEEASRRLREGGLAVRDLPVACAFHSGVVAAAAETFGQALQAVEFGAANHPIWSNVTAAPYPSGDAAAARTLLSRQVAEPVRFREQVEAMYEDGARVFVEVGAGRVLTGLVGEILKGRPHVAVAPGGRFAHWDGEGLSGLKQFLRAIARLAAHGVPLDLEGLFRHRGIEGFDLAAPPARTLGATTWMIDGFRSLPLHGELPESAMHPSSRPPVELVPAGSQAAAPRSGSGAGLEPAEGAVVEYLRNMRELAEGQREIMLGLLGTAPSPRVVVETTGRTSPPAIGPAPEPPAEPMSPAAGEPAAGNAPEVLDPREVLIEVVHERTGYPKEMLGLDQDLEAELSIDSIKRIEILSVLNEKMGLAALAGTAQEEVIEALAGVRTLRGILDWVEQRTGSGSPAESPDTPPAAAVEVAEAAEMPTAAPATATPRANGSTAAAAPAEEVERYVFRVEPLPDAKPNGRILAGTRFVIVDDGRGIAEALAARLEEGGAAPEILARGETWPEGAQGLIDFSPLAADAGAEDVKALFRNARLAAEGGALWIVSATALGGSFGQQPNGHGGLGQGGVAGLLKTVAKEYPELHVRAIDFDPEESAEHLAELVYQEITADDRLVEVGYLDGQRRRLMPAPAGLEGNGHQLTTLDSESVVLLTGGARGITALVAAELARRYGCRLELVGRTPIEATEEDADLAAATDPVALRKLLVTRMPGADLPQVEAAARRTIAQRELAASLEAIREAGSEVRYRSLDVRDAEALGALIDSIYAEHGRIDGVIHGAGVVEDKFLRHKTEDSFARVFDTKVGPALTLARHLRDDLRFLVFFSSVIGAFGNRGQADYAAANDLLDKLALRLNHTLPGRVVSIEWGPWDAGMVTPELRREYARRGIGLIPADAGIESFFEELAHGPKEDAQVLLANADLSRLA